MFSFFNRYPVFPVLNVQLMKPEKLSLHAQSIMTPPVSPVARRTRAERHQSVLVMKTVHFPEMSVGIRLCVSDNPAPPRTFCPGPLIPDL